MKIRKRLFKLLWNIKNRSIQIVKITHLEPFGMGYNFSTQIKVFCFQSFHSRFTGSKTPEFSDQKRKYKYYYTTKQAFRESEAIRITELLIRLIKSIASFLKLSFPRRQATYLPLSQSVRDVIVLKTNIPFQPYNGYQGQKGWLKSSKLFKLNC